MTRQATGPAPIRKLVALFILILVALAVLPRPLVAGQRLHSKQSASRGQDQASVTFLPVVAYDLGTSFPNAVVVADVNGDGKPDLVVTAYSSVVAVLLGNGDGTFQPASTYAGDAEPLAVITADLNGDGKQDIVVCGCVTLGGGPCSTSGITVLMGNGDGTFKPPVSYISDISSSVVPTALAVADLNGDGKLDIVAVLTNGSGDQQGSAAGVFIGNGDGTFQPVAKYDTGPDSTTIAIADVNRDGKPDLVVGDQITAAVLLGNGNGTFQPRVEYPTVPPGTTPGGVDQVLVADVDGDGKPDLVVTNQGGGSNHDGSIGVLLGNGDGTFEPVVNYDQGGLLPWSFAYTDMDGDGIPDFALADYCTENQNGCYTAGFVSVVLGNGNGTFQPPITVASSTTGVRALAAADLNGDGRPDLVVAPWTSQFGGRPRQYHRNPIDSDDPDLHPQSFCLSETRHFYRYGWVSRRRAARWGERDLLRWPVHSRHRPAQRRGCVAGHFRVAGWRFHHHGQLCR